MESESLKNAPRGDDPLDALLRAHFSAATTELPNDGFTARVLDALPAPASALAPAEFERLEREIAAERARRAWFGAAGAATGIVTLFVANGGLDTFATRAMQTIELLQPNFALPVIDADPLALATAAAITLVSLGFVYRLTMAPRKG